MRGRRLLILFGVLAAVGGCGLTSDGSPGTADRLPSPTITVTPEGGEKPHLISAIALPPDGLLLFDAVRTGGIGLRVSGQRDKLRVRHAELDQAALSVLLDALDVSKEEFCRPEPFGPTDSIQVRAMSSDPLAGFTLYMSPGVTGGEVKTFHLGAVVRPRDGSLVPVLRGTLPVPGSGSLLVIGELDGEVKMAAVLTTRLAGRTAPAVVPSAHLHEIDGEAYELETRELERILETVSLEERGGEGGFAIYRIGKLKLPRVEELLAGATESPVKLAQNFRAGEDLTLDPRSGLRIRVEFTLSDYSYAVETRRKGSRQSEQLRLADGEAVLVTIWGSDGPAASRALLLRFSPVRG